MARQTTEVGLNRQERTTVRLKGALPVIIVIISLSVSVAAQQLLAPASTEASPIAGEVMTLDRAISLALENNRSARIARLETEKANEGVAETKSYRLPQFKLTTLVQQPLSTFDTTFDKGLFGPVPTEDTVVTSSLRPNALVVAQMSQPLTQLHRINLQIKQQKAAAEITQAQLSAKEQQLVNNVKRAYYGILETQGAFESAQATIKLYQEIDRITGEYVVQQVPVMITVGATVIALFPPASHGGPLWEPMCYAQIGGLSVATFITLLLVPVLYAIFVMDLKLVKWETTEHKPLIAERPIASEA